MDVEINKMIQMLFSWVILCLLSYSTSAHGPNDHGAEDSSLNLYPTVMVTLLVRNKAHTLPYFLHYFQELDYPKHRMALWIYADHNIDSSTDILEKWLGYNEDKYHWVKYDKKDNGKGFPDEKGPLDWSTEHFYNVIRLRQTALDDARRVWADYILFTDLDNFLKNCHVLKDLMNQRKTIVAPLLNATASEHYSNFWGAMDENGYYKRSADYKSIQLRHIQGCFPVAVVHSTFLIDLRSAESTYLAFNPFPPGYNKAIDDIIIFAHSAAHNGVQMHILNEDFYGYMLVPMESENTIDQEIEQFRHLRIENIIYDTVLESLDYIEITPEPKDRLGVDQIYVVNLERRPDRLEKMSKCLDELGIEARVISAVDGRTLNDTYLDKMGIKMLPNYADPYHGRAMTMGEIGCFLSHYLIWNDIVDNGYQSVIVFEDDLRFEPYFRESLQNVMVELNAYDLDWDLVYLGRKRLNLDLETYLEGSDILVWPHYSYWTLSYMLSLKGAKKLLEQKPLSKMVPVDEYLPIMFDRHPTEEWKSEFSPRNMLALSAQPLLIYPTHYTGEPGYFTDTEDSIIITDASGEQSNGIIDGEHIMQPGEELKGEINSNFKMAKDEF